MPYPFLGSYLTVGLFLVGSGLILLFTRGTLARLPRWERWRESSGPARPEEVEFGSRALLLWGILLVIFGAPFVLSGIGLLPPFGDPP